MATAEIVPTEHVEKMSAEEQAKALLLAKAGFTDLAHLAKFTGLPHVTIWRYWHGKNKSGRFDYQALYTMADALGVGTEELRTILLRSADIRYCAHTITDLLWSDTWLTNSRPNQPFRAQPTPAPALAAS